jgi:hypothetical protein
MEMSFIAHQEVVNDILILINSLQKSLAEINSGTLC